jgi:hypothetical protein
MATNSAATKNMTLREVLVHYFPVQMASFSEEKIQEILACLRLAISEQKKPRVEHTAKKNDALAVECSPSETIQLASVNG